MWNHRAVPVFVVAAVSMKIIDPESWIKNGRTTRSILCESSLYSIRSPIPPMKFWTNEFFLSVRSIFMYKDARMQKRNGSELNFSSEFRSRTCLNPLTFSSTSRKFAQVKISQFPLIAFRTWNTFGFIFWLISLYKEWLQIAAMWHYSGRTKNK